MEPVSFRLWLRTCLQSFQFFTYKRGGGISTTTHQFLYKRLIQPHWFNGYRITRFVPQEMAPAVCRPQCVMLWLFSYRGFRTEWNHLYMFNTNTLTWNYTCSQTIMLVIQGSGEAPWKQFYIFRSVFTQSNIDKEQHEAETTFEENVGNKAQPWHAYQNTEYVICQVEEQGKVLTFPLSNFIRPLSREYFIPSRRAGLNNKSCDPVQNYASLNPQK